MMLFDEINWNSVVMLKIRLEFNDSFYNGGKFKFSN